MAVIDFDPKVESEKDGNVGKAKGEILQAVRSGMCSQRIIKFYQPLTSDVHLQAFFTVLLSFPCYCGQFDNNALEFESSIFISDAVNFSFVTLIRLGS